MEAVNSPRSPSSTPRRHHIHSSFPHYLYCTPATPASPDSLSAFVVLCESRLSESNSSDAPAEFALRFDRSTSALDVAFAGDIDPAQPAAAPPPLKPPPRLQHITNIRKSLRMRIRLQQQPWKVAGRRRRREKDDDPFVVAVEKVTREDAPWCQLPRSRRPKACETDDGDGDDVGKIAKIRRGIVECVKSAMSTRRNSDVLLSKEQEESAWLIRNSTSSKDIAGGGHVNYFVGLARCTTLSSYRNTRYGSSLSLLACFGFK